MAQRTYRSFQLNDDHLISHASVVMKHFNSYHAAFVEFNEVVFNEEYGAHFGVKIESAECTISDAFLVKNQANMTTVVREVIEAMMLTIKTISFIVHTAFRDDEMVIKEFRLNNVSSFASSADIFIGYVADLLVILDKYNDTLMASGLKDSLLATFRGQLQSLQDKRHEQLEMIEKRPVFTQERIAAMNILWDELMIIRDASEVIFHDKAELKALFALPKMSHHSKSEEKEDVALEE